MSTRKRQLKTGRTMVGSAAAGIGISLLKRGESAAKNIRIDLNFWLFVSRKKNIAIAASDTIGRFPTIQIEEGSSFLRMIRCERLEIASYLAIIYLK